MTRRKLFGVLVAPFVAKYIPKSEIKYCTVAKYSNFISFGTPYVTPDLYKEILDDTANRLAWQAANRIDYEMKRAIETV